jgi:hypothetical protein
MYGGSMVGPWWLGLGMEYWPEDGATDAAWHDGLAVVIARVGVYSYDLGSKTPSPNPIWRVMANGPVSGYAWVNMDGKPGKELVLCRQDGFVDVLDRSGQLVRSWPVGARATCVCAWDKGDAAIAVGIGDAIVFYDQDGKEVSRVAAPAEKLTVLQVGGQPMLVASGNGRSAAFH